jgi:hypothetical protein
VSFGEWVNGRTLAVATVALLIGAALPPWHRSAKVVVQEKVRTVEVEKQVVVVQERVKVERVEVATEARRVRRQETTTRAPDGTTTTVKTEEEATDKSTTAVVVAEAKKDTFAETSKREATESKSRTVTESRTQWKASALAGVDLATALRGELRPVYGGALERRVLGPFSAGAWALSNGTAGLSMSIRVLKSRRANVSESKKCNICETTKPLSAFAKGKYAPGGYRYGCKACENARQKLKRAAVAERPSGPRVARPSSSVSVPCAHQWGPSTEAPA